MNCFSFPFLFIVYFLLIKYPITGYAQENNPERKVNYHELYKSVQEEYGFDQVLVNGIFYEDYYRNAIGHPFFLENQFYTGTLVFRNKRYENIKMKYDIYEQQLVIYYVLFNSNVWVILPNDFISEFSLNGKTFRKYSFGEENSEFYQVIYDSKNLKCLYSWTKSRTDSYHQRTYNSYKFSDSKMKSYLFLDNALNEFYNNNSFVKIFPQAFQDRIKKYIKSNKIKVRVNDEQTTKLLIYCNELISAGE